jgi:hypothetical protein
VPESADHARISRVSLFGPDTRWTLARMQALCDYLNAGGWDTSPHNPARAPVE